MNVSVLLSSVGIGAVIGYVTNYVAIKLLFKPYRPVKVAGITLFPQGVIPREKKALAFKVGSMVKEYILSEEEIKKIILSPKVKAEIDTFIDNKVELMLSKNITEFVSKEELTEKLTVLIEKFISEKFSMFASFINGSMIKNIFDSVDFNIPLDSFIDKKQAGEAVKSEIVKFIETEVPKIFVKADIDKIVEEKVASFDEKTLEDMLFSLMKKHFSFINFAGAALGGLIGFVQYFFVINM
jgi:uncharacterized membrane protein YheB (UPF0754 family)